MFCAGGTAGSNSSRSKRIPPRVCGSRRGPGLRLQCRRRKIMYRAQCARTCGGGGALPAPASAGAAVVAMGIRRKPAVRALHTCAWLPAACGNANPGVSLALRTSAHRNTHVCVASCRSSCSGGGGQRPPWRPCVFGDGSALAELRLGLAWPALRSISALATAVHN